MYFFDTYLTTFLEGRNFGKTLAMSVISFFEYVQDLIYISKIQKKIQNTFFVLEIIAYEHDAVNIVY